jgi:hypothetical protein
VRGDEWIRLSSSHCTTSVGDTCIIEMPIYGYHPLTSGQVASIDLELIDDAGGHFKLLTQHIEAQGGIVHYVRVQYVPTTPSFGGVQTGRVRASMGDLQDEQYCYGSSTPALPGAHLAVANSSRSRKLVFRYDSLSLSRDTIWFENREFASDTLLVWVDDQTKLPFVLDLDTLQIAPGSRAYEIVSLDSIDLKLHRDTIIFQSNSVGSMKALEVELSGQSLTRSRLAISGIVDFVYPSSTGADSQKITFRKAGLGTNIWVRLGHLSPPFYYVNEDSGYYFDLQNPDLLEPIAIRYSPLTAGDHTELLEFESNGVNYDGKLTLTLHGHATSEDVDIATSDNRRIRFDSRLKVLSITIDEDTGSPMLVYDCLGRIAFRIEPQEINGFISIDHLHTGCYIVKYGPETLKIMMP